MEWEMILRLILAGALGAIIGMERTSKRKEAGQRTHFLVAVGSALIMMVSKYAFYDILGVKGIALDPSRIAAQVVSGVGFLGAGMIIIQRQSVRGLTTAAGLWATAGIGLAVGAGMYWVSVSTTALVLICLEFLHFSKKLWGTKFTKLIVHLRQRETVPEILKLLTNHEVKLFEYQEENQTEDSGRTEIVLELELQMPTQLNNAELIGAVQQLSGISFVRIES